MVFEWLLSFFLRYFLDIFWRFPAPSSSFNSGSSMSCGLKISGSMGGITISISQEPASEVGLGLGLGLGLGYRLGLRLGLGLGIGLG